MEAPSPILAAHTWRTNAELIKSVAQLGYIKSSDLVLDPTHGRGLWWTNFRPQDLVAHDLHTLDGVDFRDLHMHENDEFDVVAYDPPYVSVGSRVTTTLPDMQNRYGIDRAPTSPAGVQELINDGLTECARVLKPKGYLLVKCQDYVSSGHLWLGTHYTLTRALSLGLTCEERFEHIGGVRPQPPGRRQVHARRNLSTLFVFKKPGAPKSKRNQQAMSVGERLDFPDVAELPSAAVG